jgi:hypothetical protein
MVILLCGFFVYLHLSPKVQRPFAKLLLVSLVVLAEIVSMRCLDGGTTEASGVSCNFSIVVLYCKYSTYVP